MSPFKSKKQLAYLKINEPEVYAQWVKEHGTKIVPSVKKKRKGGKK